MIKPVVKKGLHIARITGCFRTYSFVRSLIKRKVAILTYHRIDYPDHFPWSIEPIRPDIFETEMQYLKSHFNVISLDELSEKISDPESLSRNTAVITIDDGYKDSYTYGYPILKKYGLPATVFLSTGYVETGKTFWWDLVRYIIWNTSLNSISLEAFPNEQFLLTENRWQTGDIIVEKLKKVPDQVRNDCITQLLHLSQIDIPIDLISESVLSWAEVKEMHQNGISFGAHTVNHPIITRIPVDEARKEILDSKHRIENELDCEVKTFCYPNGEPGDYNKNIEEILTESGFSCAVTVLPSGFVPKNVHPFRLPRITGASSLNSFELTISGLYPDLVNLVKNNSR